MLVLSAAFRFRVQALGFKDSFRGQMVFHAVTGEGEYISAGILGAHCFEKCRFFAGWVLAGLLKICNVQALGQCVFYEISTP